MKLIDFAASIAQTEIKVMSAYKGRVLCYRFKPEKHAAIGERELLSVWADFEIIDSGFGKCCQPILCAYVDGHEELVKEIAKEAEAKLKEVQNNG